MNFDNKVPLRLLSYPYPMNIGFSVYFLKELLYLMNKVVEDENKENDPKSPMFQNSCNEGPSGNAVDENNHHGRSHPKNTFHAQNHILM
jgi:hypothetical protein